ncbi:MAG: SAM-dependent methyltransferase [Prevotella sp.]|nr:SAM-dependent methyltransferase [Prevotella sp.]
MNEATLEQIRRHRQDDVRQLALKGMDPMVIQQIAGWQVARTKVPSWAEVEGLHYPRHLSLEQCSSEQTARYKASLLSPGDTFVDLTGGFGVDFFFMSQPFQRRVYVEQQQELCDIARHNFDLLNHPCTVVCGSATEYLQQMPHASAIYIDPARRDAHGARTYSISDCTPNVLELQELLVKKADRVIIKLSPMLDWHKAASDLQHISAIHIVSVQNECKELLLVLADGAMSEAPVVCINLLADGTLQRFEYNPATNAQSANVNTKVNTTYLYEPNASIMKAGCFDEIGNFYQICKLSANSHLYVSDHEVKDFPGRGFQILSIPSMNKRELKEALRDIDRANITVRNFPMSAEALRKRLRLKDGGDLYIFATTVGDGSHQLFICRKIV